MKKLLRPRPLLIGIALLGFLGFLLAIIFYRDPLCVVRADGKEIRILKWEIAEESEYDLRSRWERTKLWLSTKTPLREIWPSSPQKNLHQDPFRLNAPSSQKSFFVWYSLEEKGRRPQYTTNGWIQGTGCEPLGKEDILLLDHHGVRYATGQSCHSYRAGATIHTLVFTAFNATSPRFQLLMRDTSSPDSPDWFRFTLDNPSPQPPTPALPDTTPLPVQQDLGAITIQLKALPRFSDNPRRFEPLFHVEKNGIPANEFFPVSSWEVLDPDGGREGNVSAQAAEWIMRGTVHVLDFAAVSPQRQDVNLVAPPTPHSCQPIPLPLDKEFHATAWLIGPGTYFFSHAGPIQKAGANEAESVEEAFENYYKDLSIDGGRIGNQSAPGALQWTQRKLSGRPPALFVKAVKPTLLVLPEATLPPSLTLLVANRSSNWQLAIPPIDTIQNTPARIASSLKFHEWFVTEIDWPDWDKNPAPQYIGILLSEEIPFELRFIPSEQMRREVPKMEWQ